MINLDFISWLIITVISLIVALLWWFVLCRLWFNTKECNCPPSLWCTWVIAWLGSWLGTFLMGKWGPMYQSVAIIPAILGSLYLIVFFCCLCWCWGGRDLTRKKAKDKDTG